MALTVTNNAGAGRISSVGVNNGGSQGGSYSPQGSAPRLQSATYNGNFVKTYNPQPVLTVAHQRDLLGRNITGVTNADVNNNQRGIDKATADWQALLKSFMTPPPQPRAAFYDVAGANARARAAAEASQNPLYTKYLNDFLENARTKQTQEYKKADMANKELDRALRYTTEDVTSDKARTTEDVATNMNQIATAEDEFQTDTGTEDNIRRIEEARQLAASGQTGGLAAQQKEASQEARNTGEKRQTAAFDSKKAEQQTFKARTFEDLGKTQVRAGEENKSGKAKVKFDLDAYITDFGVGKDIKSSGYKVREFADKNEQNRLSSIADEQRSQSQMLFNSFIAGLNDPGTIAATRQKYGGGY